MERRYKAFISYRHLPLDMELAKKIQTRIERFNVPRALRKDGEKKLGRVFRDQDELPISGSLSDSIRAALDNTEYLIVICTPATKESPWVMSEIDYFIETHDRDHVLAILGDGKPDEAFPPQLTGITDENGDRIRQVEPLAANVAADTARKRNRLFRTESLRILAALVGCSYDDLYRREQRYKKRRLASVLLASSLVFLGFAGVLINRNIQIRENYERALRSQSTYLAAESKALLEKGDRLGAISLAIAALPDEGNDRPLVSQAELALAEAAGAYYSQSYTERLINAAGKLQHASTVTDFIINEDETRLVSLTNNCVVTGWDTDSFKELWSFRMNTHGFSPYLAGFTASGSVIAWQDEDLFCLDTGTGEQIWSVKAADLDKDPYFTTSITDVWLPAEADKVIVKIYDRVYVLRGADGKTVSSFDLKQDDDSGSYSTLYNNSVDCVSPDGSLLALVYQDSIGDEKYSIRVVDLEKGEVIAETEKYDYALISGGSEEINSCKIINGDLYYITRFTADYGASFFYNMITFTREVYRVYCFDLQTGGVRWVSPHESSYPCVRVSLNYTADLTPEPILALSYSNHVDLIDAETGEPRGEAEFDSAVLCTIVLSDRIQCVTRNGGMGTVHPDETESWGSFQFFPNDLSSAVILPDFRFWVKQSNSSEIVYYCKLPTSPNLREIEVEWENDEQKAGFSLMERLLDDGICAAMDTFNQVVLIGKDDPAQPLRAVTLPSDEDYGKYAFGPVRDGALSVAFTGARSLRVTYIDPETSEQESFTYEMSDQKPATGEFLTDHFEPKLFFAMKSDETVRWAALCCDYWGEKFYLCTFDETLKLISKSEIASVENMYDVDFFVDPAADDLYTFFPEDGELKRTSPHDGKTSACGEELTETVRKIVERDGKLGESCFFSADGELTAFVEEPNLVRVYREEEPQYSVATDETGEIVAVEFSPDGQMMFVIENDGYMYRYSLPDGTMLGRTELIFDYLKNISWQYTEKGFIAVSVDGVINLINTEDWTVFAYVPGAFAYQEETDLFWYASDNFVGYFPRYTVASLIEYGRSQLGDWEMSDAQKARYGLN